MKLNLLTESLGRRWSFTFQDNNGGNFETIAQPTTAMGEYIIGSIDQLRERCLIAEERMIFCGSDDETLERIKLFCGYELERRKLKDGGNMKDLEKKILEDQDIVDTALHNLIDVMTECGVAAIGKETDDLSVKIVIKENKNRNQ